MEKAWDSRERIIGLMVEKLPICIPFSYIIYRFKELKFWHGIIT